MTNFEYRKIFDNTIPFQPSDDKLDALADFMSIRENDERSKIPAGYTYLTQFIDHDIMLDPLINIQPWKIVSAKVKNQRTPFFNLESIYGIREKGEPVPSFLLENKSRFVIGETVPVSDRNVFKNDLPRLPKCAKAAIFDERNDENLIIAQMQVAFMKFHNAIVDSIGGEDSVNKFEEARRKTIRHYQWIILTDLLPKIVNKDILDDVKKNNREFYTPATNDVFMPLEFAIGSFRAGHSMINNVYNWNRNFSGDVSEMPSIHALMMQTGPRKFDGNKFIKKLSSDWVINWKWFFNIDDSENTENLRFNYAQKINTSIAFRLGRLNRRHLVYNRQFSLPALDLFRARTLGLSTGQDVAHEIVRRSSSAIQTRVLEADQLADILKDENILKVGLVKEFSKSTPLPLYILAEAEKQTNGETLGDVGSRLTAETFLELLRQSEYSILDIDFPNHADFLGKDGKFGMPELLKYADQNTGFINPLGNPPIFNSN